MDFEARVLRLGLARRGKLMYGMVQFGLVRHGFRGKAVHNELKHL